MRLVDVSVQDFVRQPSEEEWARLSVYARRMRYFMDYNSDPPSEAALKLLNTHFSGRCMLPGLRDIRWISAPPEHLEPMLPLIVSPVLTNFRLGLNNIHPLNALQVIPVLESLAPAYNSLVEVRICQYLVHDPRTIKAASTLLLKCNPDKLRYFHVDSVLSIEALIHATQLPNLEQFFIRTDTTEPGIPLPASTFPSLGYLEMKTTGTHSPLLQTLTNIQSTAFATLELEFPAAAIGTFLPTALAALRPRSLHQTLTRLSITPDGAFDLDEATIRPLLFLYQLTRLEISLYCGQDRCLYKLSDTNLEELVKAMPKLKSLCLGRFPCSHPANSTVRGFVSIAKHCKHLEELVIHANIEAIVAGVFQHDGVEGHTFEDPLPVFAECPLHTMILGPCLIPGGQQGAMVFALTLLRLFPHLVTATAFDSTPEGGAQWELVDGVIATHGHICMSIADAGKFSNLLPYTRFADVLQPLIRRSTKSYACFSFLGSLISRAFSTLYQGIS